MSEIPVPDPEETPSSRGDGLLRRIQPALTLLIAFTAIGLAAWEGIENRRHNRLSVLPRLAGQVETGQDTAGEYARMTVESTGLGPAVIRAFRVYLDGALVDTSGGGRWQEVIANLSKDGTRISAHAFGRGYYLPAGRQQLLFEARRPPTVSSGEPALADVSSRLALQICYCSIYETDCDEVLLTTGDVDALECEP